LIPLGRQKINTTVNRKAVTVSTSVKRPIFTLPIDAPFSRPPVEPSDLQKN
jgi:hypothetical protein